MRPRIILAPNPPIVNKDNVIIAGHGRVEAANLLGIKEIPILRIEHMTEDQIRAYVIADNRLAELAGWDKSVLAVELQHLITTDIDIGIIGFEMGEIDVLISDLQLVEKGKLDSADQMPAIATNPISCPGDMWCMKAKNVAGEHYLCCGSILDEGAFDSLMRGKKAAMVFVDPPYNVKVNGHVGGLGEMQHREFAMASGEMTMEEFIAFLRTLFQMLVRHSVDGSIHFVCMDWRHLKELLEAAEVYDEFKNLCVWKKDNAGMGTFYHSQHELVGVFKHGTAPHKNNFQLGQYGRYRTNVWEYAGCNSFSRNSEEGNLLDFHPTVKPVAMVADAIMDCSDRGDIVLDSVLGSGTTLIAAERTGRICYGMEIDPLYVDTAIRRWQKYTGGEAVRVADGKTFNQLEQEKGNG